MSVVWAMVRKDVQLFRSDRRALIMQVAAPVAIAAFFGFVFTRSAGQPDSGRIAVRTVDQDQSPLSRAILDGLANTAALDVRATTEGEAREDVRRGRAPVAVIVPGGFAAAAGPAFFRGGQRPVLPLLYDPSHTAELAMVRGILTQHVMQAVSREMFSGAGGPGLRVPYDVREEAVTGRRNVAYNGYAHAFAGMGVQFILFTGINLGIAMLDDRRRGIWKRVRSAPLSRGNVLCAKAASGATVAFLNLMVVYTFGIALFGVRVQGSLIGFVAVIAGIAVMASSFGLLVAAFGRTPEAARGVSIFVVLIMVMLGGAWIPTFLFPAWLQRATVAVPARWAVDGLEAMTWRGLGLESAAGTLAALLGFALLFLALAVARFDWSTD